MDQLQKDLSATDETSDTPAPSYVNNTNPLQQPSSGATSNVETSNENATSPAYRGTNVTCADFSSSTEATNYMNAYGVYKLDRDGDGIACETLGGSEETEYPEWEPSPEEPEYEETEQSEFPSSEVPSSEVPSSEAPSSTKPPEYGSY